VRAVRETPAMKSRSLHATINTIDTIDTALHIALVETFALTVEKEMTLRRGDQERRDFSRSNVIEISGDPKWR
jgi:hypothetical protein